MLYYAGRIMSFSYGQLSSIFKMDIILAKTLKNILYTWQNIM